MLKERMVPVGNQIFQKEAVFEEPAIEGSAAYERQQIDTFTVVVAGYTFAADEKRMARMASVLSGAAWRFAKKASQGTPPATAYAEVYDGVSIRWKTESHGFINVTLAQLAQVQETAITNLADVVVDYG